MEHTNIQVPGIAAKALEIAQGYVGQQEVPKGSNWGPFVEKCLKSVGIGFPAPWCQAFVHLCYEEAAAQLGGNNPVIKTGGVLDCWNKTAVNFKLLQADAIRHPGMIKPGDQFILKEGKATGHTGIVECVDGLVLHTIEGNTNLDGSREGFEVERKLRSIGMSSMVGIVRYS